MAFQVTSFRRPEGGDRCMRSFSQNGGDVSQFVRHDVKIRRIQEITYTRFAPYTIVTPLTSRRVNSGSLGASRRWSPCGDPVIDRFSGRRRYCVKCQGIFVINFRKLLFFVLAGLECSRKQRLRQGLRKPPKPRAALDPATPFDC